MVSQRKLILSRDDKKTVLEQLLDAWGLSYADFAEVIGVDHRSLWRYRKGQRRLKLETSSVKKLEKLLNKVGLKFQDLPDDWILEKVEDSEQAA